MALELEFLLKAKSLTRTVWQEMLRFFDGRMSAIEASKNLDERIREDVLGRGLQVINDHIQPALDDSAAKVAEIETLRISANAIHDQLEEALNFGANTDLVVEGPGGDNRYFTTGREQALKDDLRGSVIAARDTLKKLSDALDSEISGIRAGVSTSYDTLAEIAAAITSINTALTAKSDIGHTHTISAVSGLQGQLDAKAAATHAHNVADLPAASAAQFRAGTADRVLVTDDVWAAATAVAVPYAASIALDFSTGFDFEIGTLTGALTLGNPVNVKAGQKGLIRLVQDATGGRVLTLGANWKKAGSLTLSTAANADDVLNYWARTATDIRVGIWGKGWA